MDKVNGQTAHTLENFRRKAKEMPFSAHPYAGVKKGLTLLGQSEWTEEERESAIAAIAIWATTIVGQSTAVVLNEIVELMRIAANTGEEEHKKAADDMASSMNYVETLAQAFMTEIDFKYIGEQLFEDGERMEKERAEEEAAAEAAKAKVKAHAAQQQESPKPEAQVGKLHRWNPSLN
jgi:hypothetical protein